MSEGWTLIGIERDSRYIVTAQVGRRERDLFARGIAQTWEAVQFSKYICLFSDGERRYAEELWKLVSQNLGKKYGDYEYRKVWREGVEVALKIKGSQGNPRREWVKPEHPFTAVSPEAEVHANHNEALNHAAIITYDSLANYSKSSCIGVDRPSIHYYTGFIASSIR
jgi:hypothetical protein